MPEPWPFLKATAVAAAVGFVFVVVASRLRRATNEGALGLLAIAAGFAAGCYAFPIRVSWPPAGGLDRFLLIVLPAVLVIELAASFPRLPAWAAWTLRLVISAAAGLILLHNSVYVGPNGTWSPWQLRLLFLVGGLLLSTEWWLLLELERRSPNIGTRLSLAWTITTAGMIVMLAGYITGGAVAFPLAAALVGISVGQAYWANSSTAWGSMGFAVVGLFGVLFVGRFFGRISSLAAIVVFLSPLLAWTSELLPKRLQKPWLIALVRVAAVAIPLLVVLAMAKCDFDARMGPLLK